MGIGSLGEVAMVDPARIRTRGEWTAALQALFTRAGLSYHVLADKCDTSTSTLQKMVTGQSFPRPSTVRLFVQACGERDAQPWVDARVRVQKADAALRRHRTPPGRQIRIGAVPRPADCFQEREVADRVEGAAEDGGTVVLTQVLAGTERDRIVLKNGDARFAKPDGSRPGT